MSMLKIQFDNIKNIKQNQDDHIMNLNSYINSVIGEKTSLENEINSLKEKNESQEIKNEELNKRVAENFDNEKLSANKIREIDIKEYQINEIKMLNLNLIKVNNEKAKQIKTLQKLLSENKETIYILKNEKFA